MVMNINAQKGLSVFFGKDHQLTASKSNFYTV